MKMIELIKAFEEAKQDKDDIIGVIIQFPNGMKEYIFNGYENFDYKLEYYQNTYDENCQHKHAEGISIIAIASGDDFERVAWDLSKWE